MRDDTFWGHYFGSKSRISHFYVRSSFLGEARIPICNTDDYTHEDNLYYDNGIYIHCKKCERAIKRMSEKGKENAKLNR